ncbi:MAG: O-antigen ligase family protein [Proteobacteria bacterium]|nr:O-antigen ligase family protein [Pseudomonadota bacterium]
MKKLPQVRNISNTAGIFCIVLSCFFIPFSTSLMGATATLAALFWILSGNFFSLPQLMNKNVSVSLAIALFLLLIVGVAYSPASLNDALAFLKKYRELVYFAMVVSLFRDNEGAARLAEDSFVAGCIVLLLISYGIFFSIIPSERFGHSVVYHITHSLFMAVLAFWCLQRIFESRQYVYLWLGLFVLATINLFYIAPGRTGMLIYIALIILTFCQRFSWKKSLAAIILVALVTGVTFFTSSNFSSRISEAVDEMRSYQAESSRTSLGMRFDWYRNSIDLIQQKPVFGHGTGSFRTVQEELIKDSNTQSTDNPHNEYLLLAVQTGLVGLFLFITLLFAQFIASFELQPPRKYLLQGVVVTMAVGCLMNSFLFDSHPGHFYGIISAILVTRSIKPNSLLSIR